MIARLWRGWTSRENADAYERLLQERVLPGLKRLDGYRGGYILRQESNEEVEFVVMSLFESLEAVQAFAGPEYTVPLSPTLLIFRSEGQRSIADAGGARANTGAVHHRSLPAQYQVSRAVQVAKALYRADHGDHSDHAVHYGCRKRPNESTTTML